MSSSQWQSETQPPTKMRSSCNACTAAKIGCSKERPTCARCKRRKEKCIYVPTRRAGRPALNKQKQQDRANTTVEPTNPTTAALTPPASDSSPSAMQWADEIVVNNHPSTPNTFGTVRQQFDVSLPSPNSLTGRVDDFTQPTYSSVGAPPLPNVLSGNGSSLDDDLFSLLTEDVMQVVGDVNSCDFSRSPGYFGSIGSNSSSMGTGAESNNVVQLVQPNPFLNTAPGVTRSNAGSTTSGLSRSNSTSWFSSTLPRKDSNHPIVGDATLSQSASPQVLSAVEPETCGCLTRSLRLLQQLTPSSATGSRSRLTETHSPHSELSFESVISQNRATMHALNDIMNCSCPGDPSLLMILGLVIMKALGWYAACASAVTGPEGGMPTPEDLADTHHERARRLSIQPPSPTTMQDYDLDGRDSDRVICQLVLSELYGVQRAVNKLPRYMQSCEKTTYRPSPSCGPIESITQDLLYSGLPMHMAGSESLATVIERSLRQHLRKLSEAIQNKLSEV